MPKPKRSKLTLDQAQEAWATGESMEAAYDLLRTGLIYWHDDMIADETFDQEVVGPVLKWMGFQCSE